MLKNSMFLRPDQRKGRTGTVNGAELPPNSPVFYPRR
jgi:hypothetical protein